MNLRNRGWIWFFAALGVLAAVAVCIPLFYSPHPPLTREELAAKQALWLLKRPSDYDLEWTTRGKDNATYVVTVRRGQVQSVIQKRDDGPDLRIDPTRYDYNDMMGLFMVIEGFLDEDEANARKEGGQRQTTVAFNTAVFHPEDGHVVRFLRSVSHPRRYQLEIRVTRLESVTSNQ